MTTGPLAKVFTASAIADLAGPRSYEQGIWYHRDGRAESSTVLGSGLKATVRGTMPYAVRLWVDRDKPGWSCTCPAAEDGSFCKHCVAVALSLDPDVGRAAALTLVSARESASSPKPDKELADYVEQLSPSRLVEIVLEQAGSDWRLQERLLAEALAFRGDRVDVEQWKRRIDGAFFPFRDLVPRDEEKRWAGRCWTSCCTKVVSKTPGTRQMTSGVIARCG